MSTEANERPKHRRKQWLLDNYINTDRTAKEAAELAGVADTTISTWVRRHGISPRQQNLDLSDVDISTSKPWEDGELLETLYVEKELSTNDIAGVLGCAPNSVRKGLNEHGVDLRNNSDALTNAWNNLGHASYYTHKRSGRPVWKSGDDELFVYRLLAVAEYGFDSVCDMDVHHKNEIRWDTRPDNIEVLPPEVHSSIHRRFGEMERQRIAELYEHGDISSRDLADWLDYVISATSVRDIHKEFFGGSDEE